VRKSDEILKRKNRKAGMKTQETLFEGAICETHNNHQKESLTSTKQFLVIGFLFLENLSMSMSM